jgi:hypothetical protein
MEIGYSGMKSRLVDFKKGVYPDLILSLRSYSDLQI